MALGIIKLKMMQDKNYYYTEPKISKGKKWCVYFRFNGVLRKYYFGIAQDAEFEEKLESAIILKQAIIKKLKKGWIPNGIEKYEIKLKNISFYNALEEVKPILKNRLAARSYSDYCCTIRFVQDALVALEWRNIPCERLERLHIKRIPAPYHRQRHSRRSPCTILWQKRCRTPKKRH
ncbi:hypothetical protein [Riemerella columbipharyngis]|uniref:Uncharacterized protein n=1 Tax=Riemerella columbipharyngis TaxID=1071918 RepID=A0A1G7CV75_9FLAO|nr:hypothetical protein [Riemerella columbipharyngis]SDE42536.1 hypothetical protein SAMN05421544_10912 [Riemerella columbipharyngis]